MTLVKPPRTTNPLGTVGLMLVVILIVRGKRFVLVRRERITRRTGVLANRFNHILFTLIANLKIIVVSVRNHPIKVLQHDQQLVLAGAYDRVQLIQTQPVFTVQLTKALPVLGPIAVEIDRSIIATLEYDPITTEAVIVRSVTQHLEGCVFSRLRLHEVHAGLFR